MQLVLIATASILGVLTASVYALAIALAISLRMMSRPGNHQPASDHIRNVSVIVPCKGIYPGLKGNLSSILQQQYPCYEVIFVTPSGDSSLPLIESLIGRSTVRAKVISAAPLSYRSDKVNNQLAGIKAIDKHSEVIVFFDSDGYVLPSFLSNLVTPLYDHDHVVTTTYRWFLPEKFTMTAALTMMCSALALLLQSNRLFTVPWGGAMAMKTTDFKALRVEKEWEGVLYDDYALGLLLRRARLKASFVPFAIVINPPLRNLRAFVQEGKRHFLMLRIVLLQKWLFAFVSVNLVIIVPWILLALILRLELSLTSGVGTITVLLLPVLYVAIMQFAVSSCENLVQAVGYPTIRIPRHFMALAFIVPLIFFVQILSSVGGRTVKWQNIIYEVMAYNETRVIKREPVKSAHDRLPS